MKLTNKIEKCMNNINHKLSSTISAEVYTAGLYVIGEKDVLLHIRRVCYIRPCLNMISVSIFICNSSKSENSFTDENLTEEKK